MKCYNHPQKDAIAQCGECGKGLCEECAKKWDPPICDDCQRNNINAEFDSIKSELRLYIILAIVGAVVGMFGTFSSFSHREEERFILTFGAGIWLALCLPVYAAGWKWMNHLTDKFALFATPVGWIIYLLIKLMCSAAIGLFALPYRLYYINKRKKVLNSLLSYM